MRVLKYLISSVGGNKRKWLWVLPFRINQRFLVAGTAGGEWCPLPSQLAEMSVDSILKDSDLWWWVIKEKLKVSQPRGFYMQKLRSPLKSISLKGKLINPFMIKWLFLILWWNLNAVDGILRVGIMKFLALFAARSIQCLCDGFRVSGCELLQRRRRFPGEAHLWNGGNGMET